MTQQQLVQEQADPGLRVIHFRASNVKKLEVVDFEPDRHMVVVAGDNGAGKSSVLDAILYALGGKKSLPQEPIRRGKESAEIVLDLGAFKVERRFTKKGDYLKVTSKDGLSYPSPQSMLDALMGEIAFDPAAWLRKPAREQRAELLRIADLKLDIPANRVARQQLYDERRDVGRDLKNAEGALADLGEKPAVPEARPYAEVLALYQAAEKQNNFNAGARHALRVGEEHVERLRKDLDALKRRQEEELRRKADELGSAEEKLVAAAAVVETLKDVEIAPLTREMAAAEQASAARAKLAQHERLEKQRDELTARTSELTKTIGKLDEDLVLALKGANFPVPGLSVGEDGVTFDGLPLDQASQAEQLRVALAVAIRVQAKRGRSLRVVRILDGSLLDGRSMALVREMAEQHDFQVWVERIEREGAQIVIEDGAIAKAHGMPPHFLADGETPERGDQAP